MLLQPHRFALCVLSMLALSLSCSTVANAGVVLGGTRVIYPADARETTMTLDNKGSRPSLVQAWIDDGDDASTPDTARSPFLLTPPIFRMEAGDSQVLRILHTGEALPQDRESLFWLNVFDVPPKAAQSEAKNLLQFAFRNRIKLFYRPVGLAGSAAAAPGQLRWTKSHRDGRLYVQVSNPSPYYVSLSTIELDTGTTRVPRRDGGATMVPPLSSTRVEFDAAAADGARVQFTTIDDHGARRAATAALDN